MVDIVIKTKEITTIQVQEPTARNAEEIVEPDMPDGPDVEAKPRETAADRRNFYRKQAGWPPLRTK